MWLVAGSNALRRFKTDAFLSPNNVFLSCAVGCNLFEMNISYGFGNINAINLLSQQPSAQLIVSHCPVCAARSVAGKGCGVKIVPGISL